MSSSSEPPSVPDNGCPLVSVVIPTYNRVARLRRAIRSVQEQSYSNLEIIVVDDASSNDTRAMIRGMDDPRVRYARHETNRGGSAARNTGVRAATGQFIAFLDDDDEWMPEKTVEQMKVLKEHDAVVCVSQEEGALPPPKRRKGTLELDDLKRGGPWGGTGVLMARAEVVKETMFDESLPMGQDWDFFIRLAMKYTIAHIDKALLRYDGGDHPRITNARRSLPIDEVEKQLRVVYKHKRLFGVRWFKRQMCRGLLFGLKDREDKLTLLWYTSRRYGIANVVHVLGGRINARLAKYNSSALRQYRRDMGGHPA